MQISSIANAFHWATHKLKSSKPEPIPRDAPLPPVGTQADQRLWASQLKQAQTVLKDIDDALPPAPLTAMKGTASGAGRLRDGSTRLRPSAVVGAAGAPIQANWLTPQSLVMEMPGNKHSATWAAACLEHNIKAAIDISAPGWGAEQQSCMKSLAPWSKASTTAQFTCRTTDHYFPVERAINNASFPAVERSVGVRLVANDQLVQPRVPGTPPSEAWNNGPQHAPMVTTWLRMPMEPGRTLSPSVLLELCDHAERLAGPDGVCAFQCGDKGQQAALIAVARDIHRSLGHQSRPGSDPLDAVTEACVRARATLGPDLLRSREEIASLLGMAQLLTERQHRQAR